MKWHVRRGEDLLLYPYWKSEGGLLWREVPVGRPDARTRALDGVIAVTGAPAALGTGPVPWTQHERWLVVEVKAELNEGVIGQAGAGAVAARQYAGLAVDDARVTPVVLVGRTGDPDLEKVCTHLGIRLVVVDRPAVVLTVAFTEDDPLLQRLAQMREEEGLDGRTEALLLAADRYLNER